MKPEKKKPVKKLKTIYNDLEAFIGYAILLVVLTIVVLLLFLWGKGFFS